MTDKAQLDRILTREEIISRVTTYCLNMNGEELEQFYNRMLKFTGADRPDIIYQGDDFWTEENT